jgi:hypothetical protein
MKYRAGTSSVDSLQQFITVSVAVARPTHSLGYRLYERGRNFLHATSQPSDRSWGSPRTLSSGYRHDSALVPAGFVHFLFPAVTGSPPPLLPPILETHPLYRCQVNVATSPQYFTADDTTRPDSCNRWSQIKKKYNSCAWKHVTINNSFFSILRDKRKLLRPRLKAHLIHQTTPDAAVY